MSKKYTMKKLEKRWQREFAAYRVNTTSELLQLAQRAQDALYKLNEPVLIQPPDEPAHDWAQLIIDIVRWQRATFPTATTRSVLEHLKREVKELDEAYERGDLEEADGEMADVFHLLIALAEVSGCGLFSAVRQKFEKNKSRSWGKPDARGVVEHVRHECGKCGLPWPCPYASLQHHSLKTTEASR